MNASEAKELTKKSIQEDLLGPTMEVIYKKIKQRCTGGHSNLNHPFHGHTVESHIEREALTRLVDEGYEVKHHSGDQRDSRSCAYDEVIWR